MSFDQVTLIRDISTVIFVLKTIQIISSN